MSASSCRTMLSVRLTSLMLLPMTCVQSSCESWRLLALFFITASRPASGEVRVSWYWEDPSPALLCLSWSFALMPSYRSNMTYVSTPLYLMRRDLIPSARSPTVPDDGQTMWYSNCDASTNSVSEDGGLLIVTPSRLTSTPCSLFWCSRIRRWAREVRNRAHAGKHLPNRRSCCAQQSRGVRKRLPGRTQFLPWSSHHASGLALSWQFSLLDGGSLLVEMTETCSHVLPDCHSVLHIDFGFRDHLSVHDVV